MEYTSFEPVVTPDEAGFDAPPGSSWTRLPLRRAHAETLRYRGLELNLATGAVIVQGHEIHLPSLQRSLLKALMRRAGQILSASHLAEQLSVTIAEIEEGARTLTATLTDAGAPCLPRRVEGLGYILWR